MSLMYIGVERVLELEIDVDKPSQRGPKPAVDLPRRITIDDH